ncbi:MAG: hypothetical protein ACXWCI_11945 [Caldimonas sp.]
MSPDSLSALDRIDPVCGRQVGDGSPYRRFHGGIVFHFCSDECCGRFASEPATPETVSGATPGPVSAPMAGVPGRADSAPAIASRAPGTTEAPVSMPLPGEHRPHRRAFDVFAPFVAWQERRFAAACCQEMLKLYRSVVAVHPELTRAPLYRQIVMARSGASPSEADAVLGWAEQSFAAWPVPRALNFRDVVHYVAVQEFAVSHKNTRWIHANLKWVVSAGIPYDL